MKIEFDRDEVQSILCAYANNTLHIPANTMQIDGAGRAFLSYDREKEPQKPQRAWWRSGVAMLTLGLI